MSIVKFGVCLWKFVTKKIVRENGSESQWDGYEANRFATRNLWTHLSDVAVLIPIQYANDFWGFSKYCNKRNRPQTPKGKNLWGMKCLRYFKLTILSCHAGY